MKKALLMTLLVGSMISCGNKSSKVTVKEAQEAETYTKQLEQVVDSLELRTKDLEQELDALLKDI